MQQTTLSDTPILTTDLKNEVKGIKQLNDELKNLLENNYPYVWVRGEVGSFKLHSSGHKYFCLKEDEHLLNAVCWKGTALSANLEDGMMVECYGRITAYSQRSYYQIVVKEVRDVNRQGNILLQFEELKKKLIKQGVFELSKRSIPKYPNSIAILTSPTGAVFHDMMHRIKDRYPCCHIYFFPIPVQGNDSKKAILAALDKVNEMYEKIDLIILARGGGSLEDLWIFNNEEIVIKVANMKKPIISAIGHETDTTLCDFAADLRAPTPTAAAELATTDGNEIKNSMKNIFENSVAMFSQKMAQYKTMLEAMGDIKYLYTNALGNFGQKLDYIVANFINSANERVNKLKLELGQLETPTQRLEQLKQKLNEQYNTAIVIANMRVQDIQNLLKQTKQFQDEKEIELQNQVLITDGNKKRILKAFELRKLNDFSIHFLDGSVDAKVIK